MTSPAGMDAINGSFELVGAAVVWMNVVRLRRDRVVRGVYWPSIGFFAAWGFWNLYYYPSLDQWFSFSAGVVLVAGNAAWVMMVLMMRADNG